MKNIKRIVLAAPLALFLFTSGNMAYSKKAIIQHVPPPSLELPVKASSWDTIPKNFDKNIISFIIARSLENNVAPELIFALISVESEWKIRGPSKNRNGTYDYGLMRLNSAYIDEYVWRYGDPRRKYDPKHNIYDNVELGIKHLATLLRVCDGNTRLAVYSYNCGLKRALSGRIPTDTKVYANEILSLYDPSHRFSSD